MEFVAVVSGGGWPDGHTSQARTRERPRLEPGFRRSPAYTRWRRRMPRALVLNATDQPLAVVPARRAVVLVLKEKAEILATNGVVFRSERLELPAPAVVRLRYFVRIPYRAHAALTRRAVFARDGWVCQYCGQAAENVDHVIPRSRGGAHSWDNVVAACRRCNSRKENRLPHEVGLRLLTSPSSGPAAGGRTYPVRLLSPCAPAVDFDGSYWEPEAGGTTLEQPAEPATIRLVGADRALLRTASGQSIAVARTEGPIALSRCP